GSGAGGGDGRTGKDVLAERGERRGARGWRAATDSGSDAQRVRASGCVEDDAAGDKGVGVHACRRSPEDRSRVQAEWRGQDVSWRSPGDKCGCGEGAGLQLSTD